MPCDPLSGDVTCRRAGFGEGVAKKLAAMACTGGGLLQRHFARAPPTHCMISQSSLITPATTARLRPLAPLRSSLLHNQPTRLQALTARGAVRRRIPSVQCSAAGVGGGAGDSGESPYQTLGVSPLEKFDNIKNVYSRRKKDAESRGDAAAVENLDRAYDRIMMMQLSNRKQGLAFGGQFEVSKEIKYADKRSWIPWGPKSAPSERKEVLINLAISGFFSAWMVASGQAEWKPLQFLIFGYMFRIFNKLKEFEPVGSTYVPTEDEEEGGGAERESSRRLKSGKRLLRTLGLVFSCVAFASLAFTGTLNVYELLGQYIPRTLMGAQELFVTVVSAASLFVMGSFFR